MAQSTSRSAGGQADAVRSQFAQQTGLPFLELLSATEVESACRTSATAGGSSGTGRVAEGPVPARPALLKPDLRGIIPPLSQGPDRSWRSGRISCETQLYNQQCITK